MYTSVTLLDRLLMPPDLLVVNRAACTQSHSAAHGATALYTGPRRCTRGCTRGHGAAHGATALYTGPRRYTRGHGAAHGATALSETCARSLCPGEWSAAAGAAARAVGRLHVDGCWSARCLTTHPGGVAAVRSVVGSSGVLDHQSCPANRRNSQQCTEAEAAADIR